MKPAQFLILYFGVAVLAVFLFIRYGSVINSWVSSPKEVVVDERDILTQQANIANIQRRMAVRGAAMRGGYGGYGGGGMGMAVGGDGLPAVSKETVKKDMELNPPGMEELIYMSSENPSNAPVVTNGATVSVSALIDGVSVLLIHENNVRWFHNQWAAPGREKGSKDPTIINGEEWFPTWSNANGLRNDYCKCYSTIFSDLDVTFPQKELEIKINNKDVRGNVEVLMVPNKSNDYVTAILFDDNQNGGSAWFDVELEVMVKE